ncbi:MAG: chemotaxis protein CheC [Armatimonadetes bacterium]|nr:chemotaxis protein CheC [Armatimonadota bacterium]
MGEHQQLGLIAMSAIHEMANIGLGHAIRSLAELTAKPFNMAVPSVDTVPTENLQKILPDPECVCVAVFMPIAGDIEGYIAFLFPWPSAQALWTMLMGTAPESPDQIDEISMSAMLEIGNIINSSFLAALSDFTGLKIESTPPLAGVEMMGALATTVLAEAETHESIALSVETAIYDESHETNGLFLCIPTRASLTKLFQGLGIEEAA